MLGFQASGPRIGLRERVSNWGYTLGGPPPNPVIVIMGTMAIGYGSCCITNIPLLQGEGSTYVIPFSADKLFVLVNLALFLLVQVVFWTPPRALKPTTV